MTLTRTTTQGEKIGGGTCSQLVLPIPRYLDPLGQKGSQLHCKLATYLRIFRT
jgi:hypothetical protein